MVKVHFEIDKEAVDTLRESGFNLCLTRDVDVSGEERKGNVVFCSTGPDTLAPKMELMWEDKFQVFETVFYEGGVKVQSGTDQVDIKLGQTAKFDENGGGKVTGEVDPAEPFHVRNDWKEDARVGVSSYDPIADTYNSLFLSPRILTEMTSTLTPLNKLSVFFNAHLETDTIIDDTVSDPYQFEIIDGQITLIYSKAKPHWRVKEESNV